MREELGSKPELAWIDIDKLHVDERYQRVADSDNSKSSVVRIANRFRWELLLTLAVCPRRDMPGHFNVLDGQHRLLGAHRRGDIPKVPCAIYKIATMEEEAQIFAALNRDRIAMTPLAMHHALIAAKDPAALRIKDVCDEAEVKIRRSVAALGNTGPRETQSLGALKFALDKYGEEFLLAALMAITEAFPTDRGMLNSLIIKAVSCFFKQHGLKNVDRDRLIEVLRDNDIDDLAAEARQATAVKYVPVALRLTRILTDEYNALSPKNERLKNEGAN